MEHNISMIPFLLQGVGGEPKMNLPDRIHPNPKGHEIIAKTVHQYLVKELFTTQ
jgi:acyl-CoA thioesterase-1